MSKLIWMLICFLLGGIVAWGLMNLLPKTPLKSVSTIRVDKSEPLEISDSELQETEAQRTLGYFSAAILSQYYPDLDAEIQGLEITKVFGLTLKDGHRGWLVEVVDPAFNSSQTAGSGMSHYLVTPDLQKKLDQPMAGNYGDARCELTKVLVVLDKLVLGSQGCVTYGGTDLVAMYSVISGEKINFQGSSSFAGSNSKGISPAGNAEGTLKGVFGLKQPMVVIESYLNSDPAGFEAEAGVMAFFDLRTGKLRQLVKVN